MTASNFDLQGILDSKQMKFGNYPTMLRFLSKVVLQKASQLLPTNEALLVTTFQISRIQVFASTIIARGLTWQFFLPKTSRVNTAGLQSINYIARS